MAHAVCVEQLLRAGARCTAKTVTDQLAFSLIGENHFYGTPLNPKAPDRVPGGSSSGSASAVACGLVDFALGTDTGGSVRVPAANCGLYGLRPSHGLISVAGVIPFAPGFDTVGVLAASAEVLARAAAVLLACETPAAVPPGTVHLLRDAFELADEEVQQALVEPVPADCGSASASGCASTTLGELAGDDFSAWCETYCVIQWAEIRSCLGTWIDATRPDFGPVIEASFALTTSLDRRRVAEAIHSRDALTGGSVPHWGRGTSSSCPRRPHWHRGRGHRCRGRNSPIQRAERRTIPAPALTSVAGIGRLPQVSLPLVCRRAGCRLGCPWWGLRGRMRSCSGCVWASDKGKPRVPSPDSRAAWGREHDFSYPKQGKTNQADPQGTCVL